VTDNERSIFRNTGVMVLGRGIGDLSALAFLVIFSRAFGAASLGDYSLAMAIGALAGLAVNLGFNTMLIRQIARNPAISAYLVGSVALIQLVLATLVVTALYLVSRFAIEGQESRTIILTIGLYHVIYVMGLTYRSQFVALEKMQYSAFLEAGHKILILLLGVTAIYLGSTPDVALAVYPASAVVMYLAGLWLVRSRVMAPNFSTDMRAVRKWFVQAIPFFLVLVIFELNRRLGILVLGAQTDLATVGIYAAGERLMVATGLMTVIFAGAAYPVMSRLGDAPEKQKEIYSRCVRMLITSTLPTATLIWLLRDPIITTIYGSGFHLSTPVLGILAWGLPLTSINLLTTNLMMARHWHWIVLKLSLITFLCFLPAVWVLISLAGHIGLAYAMLLLHLIYFAGTQAYLHNRSMSVISMQILKPSVLACMGAFITFGLLEPLALPAKTCLAVFVTGLLLWVFKGVQAHDVQFFLRILRKPSVE
jgi:O-antigen/teichoic acid export membrane protein